MPRDLKIPGREAKGIHFAMDFLPQQNRRVSEEIFPDTDQIIAKNKHVIVIGGGDTGSDCIGTSIRQGALSVTQLEILPIPPEKEDKMRTWPNWPLKFRTSSSQEEGAIRQFSVLSKHFNAKGGVVKSLSCIKVDENLNPIENSEFELRADLILLAMGFVSPITGDLCQSQKIALDDRGNVKADTANYKTSASKIWTAGDMRRGQSLVVWAIREGRQCAHAVDKELMGGTNLPR